MQLPLERQDARSLPATPAPTRRGCRVPTRPPTGGPTQAGGAKPKTTRESEPDRRKADRRSRGGGEEKRAGMRPQSRALQSRKTVHGRECAGRRGYTA
eukprot:13995849-Alexandrium_andersonii.AAC.1